MANKKSLVYLVRWIPVVILLGIELSSSVKTQGQNISPTDRPLSLRDELQIEFKSPPAQGEPKESDIAGTRGNCPGMNADVPLTPVLPATSDRRFYPGLTAAEYPTLFVFVPETSAQTAQFSLYQDETGAQELYETTISLKNTPGIIAIKIPERAGKSLEIGQRYSWGFSLICPHDSPIADSSANPTIFGIIERTEVSPNVFTAIDSEASLNNALLYAQMGLWHDTLMTLAKLRQSQPDNLTLTAIWQDLLQAESVNLNDISEQPLIDCCELN